MKNLYDKLVDLYAGDELPAELKEELESAAMKDPALSHDMTSLKLTVDALHNADDPNFNEESFQRVLMKMYARGATLETREPESNPWQLRLPLNG